MRFGMNHVKPVNIPLASHFKLSSGLCPSNKEEKIICLVYLMLVQ
jgi:hypothetical protein